LDSSNSIFEFKKSEKANKKIYKILFVLSLISFITSVVLILIGVNSYPQFNWFFNSLSELADPINGKKSIIFFEIALLLVSLINILPIILFIYDSMKNGNRLEFIGLIYLLITDIFISLIAFFSIKYYDLHLKFSQALLISLYCSIIFLIIYNLNNKTENYYNKLFSIKYLIEFILLLILWIGFPYLHLINPKIGYAIPEIITFCIFNSIILCFNIKQIIDISM